MTTAAIINCYIALLLYVFVGRCVWFWVMKLRRSWVCESAGVEILEVGMHALDRVGDSVRPRWIIREWSRLDHKSGRQLENTCEGTWICGVAALLRAKTARLTGDIFASRCAVVGLFPLPRTHPLSPPRRLFLPIRSQSPLPPTPTRASPSLCLNDAASPSACMLAGERWNWGRVNHVRRWYYQRILNIILIH